MPPVPPPPSRTNALFPKLLPSVTLTFNWLWPLPDFCSLCLPRVQEKYQKTRVLCPKSQRSRDRQPRCKLNEHAGFVCRVPKGAALRFHRQHPFHCQQETKGKQGSQELQRAKLERRAGPGLATTGHRHRTTDLQLCLYHKPPFLGRDAGTRESRFHKVC